MSLVLYRLAAVGRTLGLIFDEAGDVIPTSNLARAMSLYENAAARAECVEVPCLGGERV